MSEIGTVLILAGIIAVPLSFLVRCGGAIFSQSTRERLRETPGTHIVWGLAAGLVVAYFVIGNIMTRRMVEDYQRRMAEQPAGAVTQECARSADP